MPAVSPSPTMKDHRRSFEESYVDAMEGRRTLRDVMLQIDGLGPTRNRNAENRRYPKRRSEVSLMNGEKNGKKRPLFVNERTPLAPNTCLNMLHVWKDTECQKRVGGPSFPTSHQLSVSTTITNSCLDDAIDIVGGA